MLFKLNKCVGEVLLKQWKQGNTCFSKTKLRPSYIGSFFMLGKRINNLLKHKIRG